MAKKMKKAYEKLCFVHCATVQVVNIGFLGDKMSKDDISITEEEISQRTNTAKGTTDLRVECFCQSTLPKQARNKLTLSFDQKKRGQTVKSFCQATAMLISREE